MSDQLQALWNAGYKPIVVGPQPFSFDEILRNIDPAPDVQEIYADRRQVRGAAPV